MPFPLVADSIDIGVGLVDNTGDGDENVEVVGESGLGERFSRKLLVSLVCSGELMMI